ncbi:testis-expressed protein 2 isoform X1 [Plutella xylostella]|uniref:testis-expressed protein 2 isoform X1 n=1 Tax=Plutella xylostella TaxID=51655 RepID=UPI0020329B91|nr:testis-expressed protein 2 isoform X1 [Plutella xylostella]
MDIPGASKTPNTSLSFRYNANNEELEELFNPCEDDPPTPVCDTPASTNSENASPKKTDKTSIIDKYFKSMRVERIDKIEETKGDLGKPIEDVKTSTPSKEVSSSPVKDYLSRLSKRNTSSASDVGPEVKETNETWKIFHDFKYKIAQAVEDMKSRSVDETKDKAVQRDNSISDSEDNSAIKDLDISVGDTDNQVSSLDSSIQNLSEITQPVTAKANELESSLPKDDNSDATDDTHKNLEENIADILKSELDDGLEVESGVEAFEDIDMDVIPDNSLLDEIEGGTRPANADLTLKPSTPTHFPYRLPQDNDKYNKPQTPTVDQKTYLFSCTLYILTFLLLLNYTIFPNSYLWNGFLLGMWFFYFLSSLKQYVLDTYFTDRDDDPPYFKLKKNKIPEPVSYTIPSVKEHRPLKKYEGWINHYRFPEYDPYTYHINKTTTAFMKLEGCSLRISYTKTKVAKRALWDEQIDKVTFYQHRLYNLTGARVILLPKGLVKKRQWSKKYPICVILSENEKIEVLEKETPPAAAETKDKKSAEATPDKKKDVPDVESAETNTASPEKKKKFVWRKRDKSVNSHTDSEGGREGLRHRLVRKMHRDKKAESVASSTEPVEASTEKARTDSPTQEDIELVTRSTTSTRVPDDEDEEPDMLRIKDFLEEAEGEEEGAGEGEWSVHVKTSRDKHSRLYLFTRTGRDKHEWFRRLNLAVEEANASCESSSAAEDRSSDVSERETQSAAVYCVQDKEVKFSGKTHKTESISDSVPQMPSQGLLDNQRDFGSYEKTFWPFLFKILQTKSSPTTACECRMLPPEVTWVNTVLARMVFDAMRDPNLVARVQDRIQRKLHTMKLPSFMSPLIVTNLSLAGACPLLEHVSAPTWDARGVWLDAALRYDGGAYITILTQINLMKLKEKNLTLEEHLLTTASENVVEDDLSASRIFSEKQLRERKPAIFDSEFEDSAESSSDDESPQMQPVDSNETMALDAQSSTTDSAYSKKKFLKMVDRIATNKYFQTVTDYKYVKKAMEGLSNTDIKLRLEVQGLEGRLAVNLPPPPHDRIPHKPAAGPESASGVRRARSPLRAHLQLDRGEVGQRVREVSRVAQHGGLHDRPHDAHARRLRVKETGIVGEVYGHRLRVNETGIVVRLVGARQVYCSFRNAGR